MQTLTNFRNQMFTSIDLSPVDFQRFIEVAHGKHMIFTQPVRFKPCEVRLNTLNFCVSELSGGKLSYISSFFIISLIIVNLK